ncbi:MAG: cytochrome C, partial [Lentisphaeraceae bacterium]|nr:cytochrome C [Lentisphaeraceae bacterium]
STKAAVSNWSGDVWTVSGVDKDLEKLTWKRIATGLYHPLGLAIVKDSIYVVGRDQITKLVDLNGDGETDFYESFNNDVEVTWNFHEFTFDLQADEAGNFYYSKGAPVRNGGRGFDYVAKHNGTVVKVSPDGKSSKVFATGLRAPNGISVRKDGQVTTGDNEGSWMPQCRLNLVEEGGFYGVMNTAHRKVLPKTYDAPICWFPKSVDNSGGGQAWVESDKWGPFKDDLLHLSYGTCSLYKVMYEKVNGVPQGGVVRLPVNFSTGIMRAKFNDGDGQLYVCGLRGWQTSAAQDGAFSRVRYTGAPLTIPTGLKVVKDGIEITFTNPVDKDEAGDVQAYAVSQWNYKYSEAYGSSDYSLAKPGEKGQDTVKIKSAKVSADGKTVKLEIPSISPVMQMRIKIDILDAKENEVFYEIYNTINVVPK